MPAISRKLLVSQLRQAEPCSGLADRLEVQVQNRVTPDALDAVLRTYAQLGGELTPAERGKVAHIGKILGSRALFSEPPERTEVLHEVVRSQKPGERRRKGARTPGAFSSFTGSRQLDGATVRAKEPWKLPVSTSQFYNLPVLSPDQSRVLYQAPSGTVSLIDRVEGRTEWELAAGNQGYSTPAFHPDGERAFVAVSQGGSGELWCLDVARREVAWKAPLAGTTTRAQPNMVGSPVLSPDGESVFLLGTDGRFQRLSTRTGDVLWSAQLGQNSGNMYSGTVVSQDGTRVFQADDSRNLLLAFDVDTGEVLWEAKDLKAVNNTGAVTPDGALYLQPNRGALVALDTETGRQVWSANVGNLNGFERPIVSRDGRYAFMANHSGQLFRIDVSNGALDTLEHPDRRPFVHAPVLSAEGSAAYVLDNGGTIHRMDFDTRETRPVVSHGSFIQGGFSMTSDAGWVVYGSANQLYCVRVEDADAT